MAGHGEGEHESDVRVMDPLCHQMRWVAIEGVVDAIIQYNDLHREPTGTADLIVLTVPPPEDGDGDPDAPNEPPDAPEPPLDPIECDPEKAAKLLARIPGALRRVPRGS